MTQSRGTKIIAIVALCIAVTSLSIGFALFTRDLTIKSSAEVNVSNNMRVEFVDDTGSETNKSVTGTKYVGDTITTDTSFVNAGVATIDGTTIKDLKATFTAPGQKVTYAFKVKNFGPNDAWLNTVTYAAPTATCTPKTKTADNNPATADLATAACAGMSVKVSVGGTVYSSGANPQVKIAEGSTQDVIVTIEYAADSKVADGDFDVTFGDVTLTDGSQAVNTGA